MNDYGENISFVVQGAIEQKNDITKKCLLSIKEFFPKSEIILSTWKDAEISGLLFDTLVTSKDPGDLGSYYQDRKNLRNNSNRQLVSTIEGIKESTRSYVVKVRSDMCFTSSKLSLYLENIEKCQNNLLVCKLITLRDHTINPSHFLKLSHHPSDFIYAGRREDMLYYFNSPLQSKDDANFFEGGNYPDEIVPKLVSKFANEQYLLRSFLQRVEGNCLLENAFDCRDIVIKDWYRVVRNYFILLSEKELGVYCQKYKKGLFSERRFVFSKKELKLISKNEYERPFFDVERCWYNLIYFIKVSLEKIKLLKFLKKIKGILYGA